MYIKRFSIATLLFMFLVGWYVFGYVSQESITVESFGLNLPILPVAIWVLVPIAFLYIASVAHMSYYYFLESLKTKRYQKDYEKFLEALNDAYLSKSTRTQTFKSHEYKLLGKLINHSDIVAHDDLIVEDDKLSSVVLLRKRVKNGEVVSLKEYNLSDNNELVIKNNHNMFDANQLDAETVLSKSEKYDVELCKKAYMRAVATAELALILSHKKFMSKDALFVVLKRINADEHRLTISNEELSDLFESVELSVSDYINASRTLRLSMIPDHRMKFFELLSEKKEVATCAYLYTLFDLEMIDKADEILENSQDDEYMLFKAYRELKNSTNRFSIDLFV